MAKSFYIDDNRIHLARGLVHNAESLNIFGTTGDLAHIVTGSYRTPWELPSDYVFPSSALTMSLVSTAADNVPVLINGLDANWDIQTEVVTLTGITPVTTTKQFLRINDVIITAGNATGAITVTNGGVTYAKINAGTGRNQAGIFTVPRGHCFFLERIDAFCTDANGGKAAQFRNFLDTHPDSVTRELRVANTTFFNTMNIVRRIPFKYDEKTDIKMQLKSLSGSVFGSIFAEGILVKL